MQVYDCTEIQLKSSVTNDSKNISNGHQYKNASNSMQVSDCIQIQLKVSETNDSKIIRNRHQ